MTFGKLTSLSMALALSTQAYAFNAEYLRQGCSATLSPELSSASAYWSGYCFGTVETMVQILRSMTPMQRSRQVGICLPGDELASSILDPVSEATKKAIEASYLDLLQNGQRYTVDYIEKTPLASNFSPMDLVVAAFKSRYPCPRK